MNEEALELVMKYPELLDRMDVKYRKDLFVLYCKQNPLDSDKSYLRIADAYNKAKMFKVTAVSQAIQEIFDLNKDNVNMQISYAKKRGAITSGVKTTHGRGYLQANYNKITKDKQLLLDKLDDEIEEAMAYLDYNLAEGLRVARKMVLGEE